jgi:hypothetical protein
MLADVFFIPFKPTTLFVLLPFRPTALDDIKLRAYPD